MRVNFYEQTSNKLINFFSKKLSVLKYKNDMAHPILTYDFTASKDDNDLDEIKSTLDYWCREWVFQAEKGGLTGYEHYQGRLKLKTKKRLVTLAKALSHINGIHLSPTSMENIGNNFYVTKEDTRIAGPWYSENNPKAPQEMPWDLAEIKELLPWQNYVVESIAKVRNKRCIDVVYDPVGNTGKTTLTRYMLWHKLGEWVPFCENYKDMVQIVMDLPKSPCYLIDLPRALPKKNLEQMYSAIETIKGGVAYDQRYEFRRRMFGPPRVIVFTNVLPPTHYMTDDRWNIWSIKNNELVKYVEPKHPIRQKPEEPVDEVRPRNDYSDFGSY